MLEWFENSINSPLNDKKIQMSSGKGLFLSQVNRSSQKKVNTTRIYNYQQYCIIDQQLIKLTYEWPVFTIFLFSLDYGIWQMLFYRFIILYFH